MWTFGRLTPLLPTPLLATLFYNIFHLLYAPSFPNSSFSPQLPCSIASTNLYVRTLHLVHVLILSMLPSYPRPHLASSIVPSMPPLCLPPGHVCTLQMAMLRVHIKGFIAISLCHYHSK